MSFSGVVAAVTGGGSGIGEACARALAARGARVAVIDLNLADAERVAGEIGGLLGPFLMGVAYDVSGGFGLALGSTSVLLAGLIVMVWFLRRADAAHREG